MDTQMTIGKILQDSFTTATGTDFDLGRILWAISVLAGIAYAGFDLLYLKSKFDITTYGIGIGTLLAAGAGSLYIKRDTESK
jgi:hypothetical protein